ncbi:MAG: glycine cleavage system protein GcvH [Verrucomicrobiales bacterium]
MTFPNDLRYTTSHEWIRLDGDVAIIGITDHAQTELGDVVYLDLPAAGRTVKAGEGVAVIESVKAASDIYAPVAGEIIEANSAAAANTSLVNSDPYGDGWLFKLKVADPITVSTLLDSETYQTVTGNR